ncbi:hypothetical protein HGRIS_002592 [Hohenbuehelia grisea]|uniref:Uncharacterized protein n=1 Tax=Hohenbuehelia grisea TaxID=104357 RepID=A0ABR3JKZ5_9AGAR
MQKFSLPPINGVRLPEARADIRTETAYALADYPPDPAQFGRALIRSIIFELRLVRRRPPSFVQDDCPPPRSASKRANLASMRPRISHHPPARPGWPPPGLNRETFQEVKGAVPSMRQVSYSNSGQVRETAMRRDPWSSSRVTSDDVDGRSLCGFAIISSIFTSQSKWYMT